jgi:GntR family transcriptional repressor for pyruvate dehydrogenase complex
MQQKFLAPVGPMGRTAPELIFRQLSEAMSTGDLKAGDRLPAESELADALGVAPMTLRRALSMLREIGLIHTTRGRYGGNFVAENVGVHLMEVARKIPLTRSEMRDLADWRRAISGEACFLAAERGTPEDFAAIALGSAAFDDAVAELPTMRVADARFHRLVAEGSKSPRLMREEGEIQLEMNKLILTRAYLRASRPMLLRCHEPIANAIIRRDAGRARIEMLAHVETTYNWGVGLAKE